MSNALKVPGYEELRVSEQQLRAVFESAFEFIGVLQSDGIVTDVNRGPLAWYGLRKDEVVGRFIWDTPHFRNTTDEDRQRVRDAVLDAAGGRFVRYELEVPSPDGGLRTFDFSLTPIVDEAGSVVAIIAEGRDITERKRMERALRETNVQLEAALAEVQSLRGLLPICAWCKNVRDDQDFWHSVEAYITAHTEARFTHSICPGCLTKQLSD